MNGLLPLDAIRRCADDARFREVVADFYRDLDGSIAQQHPVCTNKGDCCRFGVFGHLLFATSVELAFFFAMSEAPQTLPDGRSSCPYQLQGRCTARAARPIGCRIFFCDPDAQDWQPEMTERSLTQLQAIGHKFGIPYSYTEWTDSLRSLFGNAE